MSGQSQSATNTDTGTIVPTTTANGAAHSSPVLAQSSQSLALAKVHPPASTLTIQTQYCKPLPGNRPIRPGGLPNPVTYTAFKSSSLPGERPIAVGQLKNLRTDNSLPANRPIASNQPTDTGINSLIGYLD